VLELVGVVALAGVLEVVALVAGAGGLLGDLADGAFDHLLALAGLNGGELGVALALDADAPAEDLVEALGGRDLASIRFAALLETRLLAALELEGRGVACVRVLVEVVLVLGGVDWDQNVVPGLCLDLERVPQLDVRVT